MQKQNRIPNDAANCGFILEDDRGRQFLCLSGLDIDIDTGTIALDGAFKKWAGASPSIGKYLCLPFSAACRAETQQRGVRSANDMRTSGSHIPMATDPYRHSFAVGDRVKILTSAVGCYNEAAGTVVQKLDNALQPYPDGQEPDIPDFYCARTDKPVDIGGGMLTVMDVHPARQVFPIDSPVRNYWNIRQKKKLNRRCLKERRTPRHPITETKDCRGYSFQCLTSSNSPHPPASSPNSTTPGTASAWPSQPSSTRP